MYDIIVIGAGVVGTCIARELSKYQANVCVIDKGDDVASGTSKANSGIVHAGYDCKPGTLMAKLNVRGNELLYQLAEELDFPIKKNGSLIVCTVESERGKLDELLAQANANGVPDARIVERDELLQMEPNLSPNSVAALYVPTGGIICPFNLAIAMGENAAVNGVEFKFETKVENIVKKDGHYELDTNKGVMETKAVVNAAGVYADVMHNMVSEKKMKIVARKGEYLLMDKELGNYFTATIFPLPGPMGKGVLTAPTIHGNMFVGPSATDIEDKEGVNTTAQGLEKVVSQARLSAGEVPLRMVITSFAGLRATEKDEDFVLGESPDAPGFFNAAGIESPGLSSAPAIGEYLAEMIAEKLQAVKKENFISRRKDIPCVAEASPDEIRALIAEDPAYGNVICRCETVTEGEIVNAIRRPLGARSLDGVKRRTRAGMGRCQAGFCSPRTMEILARELKESPLTLTKAGGNSKLLAGEK